MKDYFSHDYNSRNDKKIVLSFMKFGLEAIGAYWCIVEMLYEEGGYLLLSEYDRITFELRTSNELIRFLIYDSNLFENDGNRFWSETAIERLKLRSEKSEKARKSIENRWNRKNNTNVIQTNNERNTSKVKESKIKEKKVKAFIPPSENEVIQYFKENGYDEKTAKKMFMSYSVADWVDSKGNKIKNWKQKAINVWFKEENKIQQQLNNSSYENERDAILNSKLHITTIKTKIAELKKKYNK